MFAGGFTLEAAEAVCAGDGLETWEVLDLVSALVHKSLVVAEGDEEVRYRLLETVRQYAEEKLVDSDEAAVVRNAHRDWYAVFAERALPHLVGHEQVAWYRKVALEQDNFRAALSWSRDDPEGAEMGLRLAVALGRFWRMRGHYAEGRAWLREALERGAPTATPARARALDWLGAHGARPWRQPDPGEGAGPTGGGSGS